MRAKKSTAAAKVASWDRIWGRWVRATDAGRRSVLRAARAWSKKTGEPLPLVMQ